MMLCSRFLLALLASPLSRDRVVSPRTTSRMWILLPHRGSALESSTCEQHVYTCTYVCMYVCTSVPLSVCSPPPPLSLTSLSDKLSENYYYTCPNQTESTRGGGVGDAHPPPGDPPHPSMFANERLPGPLPLKAKPSKLDPLVSPVPTAPVGGSEGKQPKEVGILYLAQLRKSPYPINGCLRVNHRAARSHFKRHADIKHRGGGLSLSLSLSHTHTHTHTHSLVSLSLQRK